MTHIHSSIHTSFSHTFYSSGTVLGFADRVANQMDETPAALSDISIAGHRCGHVDKEEWYCYMRTMQRFAKMGQGPGSLKSVSLGKTSEEMTFKLNPE